MTTIDPGVEAGSFAYDAPVHQPTMVDVVRSEWLKLRSVRSTYWTMAVVFVAMVGFGALISFASVATWDQLTAEQQAASPVNGATTALAGALFGQLAMVVIGVLTITSEYSTGGIRSTLVAVPRRNRVVVAKALVLGFLALVVGMVSSFVAFFVGQAILATKDFDVGIGDPNVARAVAGTGLYLAGCALFGLGVGLIIRSSGGGITLAIASLFVLPPLALLIPGSAGDQVQKFLPSNAGQAITDTVTQPDRLGPWVGYLVFTVWWVVLLAIGSWLLRRRDI
jgi:ABC-type transport system involved in multi-copper enzyme maturation permease subunit